MVLDCEKEGDLMWFYGNGLPLVYNGSGKFFLMLNN
jgi:hypothetical protein